MAVDAPGEWRVIHGLEGYLFQETEHGLVISYRDDDCNRALGADVPHPERLPPRVKREPFVIWETVAIGFLLTVAVALWAILLL